MYYHSVMKQRIKDIVNNNFYTPLHISESIKTITKRENIDTLYKNYLLRWSKNFTFNTISLEIVPEYFGIAACVSPC